MISLSDLSGLNGESMRTNTASMLPAPPRHLFLTYGAGAFLVHDKQRHEPFWRALRSRGEAAPALIDADSGEVLTYAQLSSAVQSAADALGRDRRSLVLLFANNDIASVVCYLAALEAGHAIFISPVDIGHRRYRPPERRRSGSTLSARDRCLEIARLAPSGCGGLCSGAIDVVPHDAAA
jgi:hypothetical protein